MGRNTERAPSPFPHAPRRLLALACLLAVTLEGLPATAAEWARFRGPNGSGVGEGPGIPVRFGAKDFLWKTPLPGGGHSSPVIWDGKIFVTCADEETARRKIVRVDLDDGRVVWARQYASAPYSHHRDNSFAAASPAADASGVYVTWTTPEEVVLLGLDHDGNERWRRSLGPFESRFGSGASPIAFEGLVILANDQLGESFLLAVDRDTGETRWKVPRRSGPTSYATPCARSLPDGAAELIFLNTVHGMTAVDPRTGAVRWEVDDLAENLERERPVASPIPAGDLVVGAYGMAGQGTQVFSVRPGGGALDDGSGGEAGARLAHRLDRAAPYVPTPLALGDLLFLLHDNGRIACHRLPGHELLWRERLPASFYSSPVCAGDRLYCVSKAGEVFTLRAGEEYELLARSDLGEPSFATPAIARGMMVFRTSSSLICVGGREGGEGGETSAPGGPDEPLRLESPSLSLELAPRASGMGVVRLEHRAGEGPGVPFVSADPASALLWRLTFRGAGADASEVRVDNLSPARRWRRIDRPAGTAELGWDGIDLGEEKGVLDVKVEVRLPPAASEASFRISAVNRSAKLGPWEVHFPVLGPFGERGGLDVAVPRGNWGILARGASAPLGGYYPSHDWPMQFLLASRGERGLGLYVEDSQAWPKRFHLDPGGELSLTIYPEERGKPGQGLQLPGPVSIGAYRGSWWRGAKRYRSWALQQPWARRGRIAERDDFPEALRRTALWWLGGGKPEDVVPRMKEAIERFDVPLALHWYNWHEIPFDVNYPEYFPTKAGFGEAARELVRAGVTVMPYINGRLWDVAGEGFAAARPAACKKPGGADLYVETYGSGAELAPMCPATPLWQAKVGEIVRRLVDECGVNAIYIDQIASAGPVLCHDPAHGHPLGGGGHWVDGYRKMLEPLRDLASRRGVVLTSENNAEPYLDTIDAFLIWLPRTGDEIPLITAVYGGHAVYFASPSRAGMELDAFCMLQGRDLLWGSQLGWMGFDLLEPEREEHAEYLRRCVRYRRELERYLLEGELLGELDLLEEPPPIRAEWGGWQGTHPATLPSVVTAIWRATDGRIALLAANLSGERRALAFELDLRSVGIPEGARPLRLERVRPGGRDPLGEVEPRFERHEVLEPREIWAVEITTP